MKFKMSIALAAMACLVSVNSATAQNQCPASQCPASKGEMSQTISTGVMETSINEEKDIVDTAVAAGSFKTLAAALTAAELVDTLKGDGPFTVFAPTDAAFAKLPAGTIDTLLKPENKKKLQEILTYHVAPGKLEASDVIRLRLLETVLGKDVLIKVDGDKVSINGANVTATDIQCSNGVIHVIDAVILPK